MIQPDSLFSVWSPDTVAECLEGVTKVDGLYNRLWAIEQPDVPRSEVPDDFGTFCLANFWDQLSPEDQAALNELAKAV